MDIFIVDFKMLVNQKLRQQRACHGKNSGVKLQNIVPRLSRIEDNDVNFYYDFVGPVVLKHYKRRNGPKNEDKEATEGQEGKITN